MFKRHIIYKDEKQLIKQIAKIKKLNISSKEKTKRIKKLKEKNKIFDLYENLNSKKHPMELEILKAILPNLEKYLIKN